MAAPAGKMEGKVVIVTGGASGIGAGTALALVQEGAKVVLADINEEKLVAMCEEIKQKTSGEVVYVVADVSKEDDNRRIVEVAVNTFGGLHGSFINAGVVHWARLEDMSLENIDDTFGPNFKGVVFGLKHQLPAMAKSGDKGAVVVTSSLAAFRPLADVPEVAMYACSKAAAEMMVNYGAIEGAALSVRVNGIAPGTVWTPMTEAMGEEVIQENWKNKTLTGKGILIENVVPLVTFLLSEDSQAITGAIHRIDQGAWMK